MVLVINATVNYAGIWLGNLDQLTYHLFTGQNFHEFEICENKIIQLHITAISTIVWYSPVLYH